MKPWPVLSMLAVLFLAVLSQGPSTAATAPQVASAPTAALEGRIVNVQSGSDLSESTTLNSDSEAVTETFFFGSSSTDTGNFNALFLPVPDPPYFEGRFSNGPVWAEYFTYSVGTSAKPSALGGTNYALAGARTGVVNFGFIPPITAQVSDYLSDVDSVADKKAIYLFQTGANDLIAAKLQSPETAKQTMRDVVAFTAMMLNDLYDAGARNFVLFTVPEIPTAPTSPILPDGTNLALLANDGLEEVAEALDRKEGASVLLFDLHGLTADIVMSPDAFGIEITRCSYMGKSALDILSGDITPEPCEPA
ncbi:MAG: SGNH/GDSL hydrolase family protein, partial [Candidatus Promineifilaceae bacterium]|nr:SGNH/GDSL hydrolase family protein [Candidatus Promineifilaceae bacterium]